MVDLPAREAMEFDVVIVGAGPSGLSAAIRLKQINPDISVVIVEKGSEVGAHILSGAVIDPAGLDRLLPDWRSEDTPIKTAVADDRFYWLNVGSAIRLPNFAMPPLMGNHGNFIVSLGSVCRWLAGKAEALGVEIYPGFAASEVLFDEAGSVAGIATGDMGIGKNKEPKDSFTRGMELRAKYTLFAEGARGSLGKQLIAKFGLSNDREPQKFGLGLKELWQVAPEKHRKGLVQHSFGWPLDGSTGAFGGTTSGTTRGSPPHLNTRTPGSRPSTSSSASRPTPRPRHLEGGKARLRRARHHRRRPVSAAALFPGGALLGCGRHGQPAAHQGQPQRDTAGMQAAKP